MDVSGLLDGFIGNLIALGIGVGVTYMILRATGVEKKAKQIREGQYKKVETGWGKAELERLTKMEILKMFKFGRTEKRHLFVGHTNVGKIAKSLEFGNTMKKDLKNKNKYYIYLVKSGFLGLSKEIYYVSEEEISYHDEKGIYINSQEIHSVHGLFCTITNITAKIDTLKLMMEKIDYEDLRGRTSNLATQASYLDLSHAQQMEALSRRIEALQRAEISTQKSVEDFI